VLWDPVRGALSHGSSGCLIGALCSDRAVLASGVWVWMGVGVR
jgi:hypothetical protein